MGYRYRDRNIRFIGKQLRKVLRNLPDNGVGRLVVRGSEKQVEGEPTYYRILEADLTPTRTQKKRKTISVKAEKVFRGVKLPKIKDLRRIAYFPDFMIVREEDEEKYLNNTMNAVDDEEEEGEDDVEENTEGVEEDKEEEEKDKKQEKKEESRSKDAEKLSTAEINRKGNVDKSIKISNVETCPKDVNNSGLSNTQIKKRERNYIRSLTHISKLRKAFKERYRQEKFGDFGEKQMQRINNMIENGMNADTARQIEWEREAAFKSKR